MKRLLTILCTIVAAIALLQATAQPATAKDARPCVSRVEYWASVGYPDPRRAAMEERWEVAGLGKTMDLTIFFPWANGPAWEGVAYPRCGYNFDSDGWYGILYRVPASGRYADQQIAHFLLQYHVPGATQHGRPRQGLAFVDGPVVRSP